MVGGRTCDDSTRCLNFETLAICRVSHAPTLTLFLSLAHLISPSLSLFHSVSLLMELIHVAVELFFI